MKTHGTHFRWLGWWLPALGFLMLPAPVPGASSVQLSNPTWTAGGSVVNLTPASEPSTGLTVLPTLAIDAAPQDGASNLAVRVVYTSNPALGLEQTLTLDGNPSGGNFAGAMPARSQGLTYFYFEAECDGEDPVTTRSPETGHYRYLTTYTLDPPRDPDPSTMGFSAGSPIPNVYKYWTGTVWADAYDATTRDNSWNISRGYYSPAYSTALLLQNASSSIKPHFRSPKLEGVGCLYFKAMALLSDEEVHTLDIETAVSSGGPWTFHSTVTVPVSSSFTAFRADLNDYRSPLYVRIRRISVADDPNNYIAIKDITLSPPPADIVVSEPSIPTPGYPSKNDDITFYCHIDNVSARYPAIDIQPKLMWRMGDGAFAATNMTATGGGDYAVTLPPQAPGTIDYYLRVEFSGSSSLHEGHNESHSPTYLGWDGVADVNTEQQIGAVPASRPFPVRMFDSYHQVVELRRYDTLEVEPMRLVGDQVWQTVLYLTNAVVMDLQFAGVRPYYDGAAAYDPQDELFSDDGQATFNPPLTGNASPEATTNILVTVSNYVGTVMFRLNVASGRYEVRKAAFQDFNTWQASHQYFEESQGLFAIQNYETDFDTLPATVPSQLVKTHFNDSPLMAYTPPFEPATFLDLNQWQIENAWVMQERMAVPAGESGFPTNANRSVRIYGGGGSLQSTEYSHTSGRDALRFRPRLSFGDQRMPHFLPGFAGFKNYRLQARATPTNEVSPANPTVSLVGYRRDQDNYYELRLTQNRILTSYTNTLGRDRVYFELYRWNSGAPTRIGTTTYRDNVTLTHGAWELALTITNGVGTAVHLSGTIGYGTSTYTLTATEANAGVLVDGGTVGFNVSDAVVHFDNLQLLNAPGGGSKANLNTPSDWYLGGTPVDGAPGETLWTFAGSTMIRPLRPVNYEVLMVRTGEETALPGLPQWEQVAALQATSLQYPQEQVTLPIKTWDNTFLRIVPLESDSQLVVDNLEMRDWRGQTPTDPEEVPVNDPAGHTVWRATEAYVTERNGSHQLELTRSRANPDQLQMLVSPVLDEGVGTVEFAYEASGGNVRFVVERASFNGLIEDDDPWEAIADPVEVPADGSGYFYQPVRTNMIGRVRVRMDPAGCEPSATLWLDQVKVTSSPPPDNTSWKAYNALISAPDMNPETDDKQFEPADDGTRSAFLNENATNDVATVALADDAPFIQSPLIETGIGEIGFWFRAWDPGAPNPGKIRLMMAPSPELPTNEWVEVTIPDDPEADLAYKEQLGNITNSVYEYFTIEIFDKDNKVLRIYAETNGASRVALDNIIVTEPVRTSIDIASVTLNPAIPLTTNPVHVAVQLANPRMNPENIEVTLHYYPSTNFWGWANWKDAPDRPDPIVLIPAGPPLMYATPPGQPIPGMQVDAVVQYQVVVTYEGTFPAPVEYEGFTNPDWYFPVDLNEQHAGQGFSPYYFVFSCPTGVVFFNEFHYASVPANANREFIELIGPRNLLLKNWRVDVVDASESEFEDVVNTSYPLPSDARLQDGTNGWGFFVLGDNGAVVSNQVDYFFPDGGDPDTLPIESARLPLSGGFRLVRSMGAYADRISYGNSSIAQENMPARGYTYTKALATFGINANRTIGLMLDYDQELNEILSWQIVALDQDTPSAMNPTEAVVLGEIDAYPEEDENPPAVAALTLAILDLQIASGQVALSVWADSADSVTNLTGWIGVLETNPTPSAAGWGAVPGTATDFTAIGEYPFGMAEPSDPVFFRIKATNPNAE